MKDDYLEIQLKMNGVSNTTPDLPTRSKQARHCELFGDGISVVTSTTNFGGKATFSRYGEFQSRQSSPKRSKP